jgi:type I restriction enzyme S subunit
MAGFSEAEREPVALDISGTSGRRQRVNPTDALIVAVRDPGSLTESERLAIEAALDLATAARYENRNLAATRDALLPQLMSSKLRVGDAGAAAFGAGA